MKNVIIISLLFFSAILSAQQQDPEAQKILDRVSAKNKNYLSIQTKFVLTIENRRDDKKSSTTGILKIKGSKYYMESFGTKVFFDGKTIWSYTQDLNEVTINEPDTASGDFIENPARIFDFYNKDFKYRLIGETKMDAGWMYEIDLFPKDLEQPYSRFKIFVKRDTEELYQIKAIGKDGIDYTATLKDMKYNEIIPDESFVFQPSKYKGVEVIDMRF